MPCMVPFADMLNHRNPMQTDWSYDDQRGGFVMKSLEDIPQGAEVTDSYGEGTNAKFLLCYGFIDRP